MDNDEETAARMMLRTEVKILRYFKCDHLPLHLQSVALPCSQLADEMASRLPVCAEMAAGLRKLLEAKDCFVRAALDKQEHTT